MKNLAEVDSDLDKELQLIADTNECLLLGFIAPDKLVRRNPVAFDYATITVNDLYNLEKEIDGLLSQNRLPKKLHLIIQTPGGDLYAATKIVYYLQSNFQEIIAFVPYEAASGGTLLCLSASRIIMDAASSLTPIDPQIKYKGQTVAATSYDQAIREFQRDFGKLSPSEIPSPYQQISEKFDPIISKEMSKAVFEALNVAYKVLNKAHPKENNQSLLDIVFSLVKTDYPHSHVITKDEAKKIGLKIDDSKIFTNLLKTYKKWVSVRLNEEEAKHIIESYSPRQIYDIKATNDQNKHTATKKTTVLRK